MASRTAIAMGRARLELKKPSSVTRPPRRVGCGKVAGCGCLASRSRRFSPWLFMVYSYNVEETDCRTYLLHFGNLYTTVNMYGCKTDPYELTVHRCGRRTENFIAWKWSKARSRVRIFFHWASLRMLEDIAYPIMIKYVDSSSLSNRQHIPNQAVACWIPCNVFS